MEIYTCVKNPYTKGWHLELTDYGKSLASVSDKFLLESIRRQKSDEIREGLTNTTHSLNGSVSLVGSYYRGESSGDGSVTGVINGDGYYSTHLDAERRYVIYLLNTLVLTSVPAGPNKLCEVPEGYNGATVVPGMSIAKFKSRDKDQYEELLRINKQKAETERLKEEQICEAEYAFYKDELLAYLEVIRPTLEASEYKVFANYESLSILESNLSEIQWDRLVREHNQLTDTGETSTQWLSRVENEINSERRGCITQICIFTLVIIIGLSLLLGLGPYILTLISP